ncbi:DUF6144 family protein [Candidatus Zixiibacteriota bacterium]
MGNPEWPHKMTKALGEHLEKGAVEEIMAGSEQLAEMDEKARAAWMTGAMDKIDEHVADQEIKIKILTACSCECYVEHLDEFKKEWNAHQDIDKLLALMHGKVFLNKPERERNIVYITKAPRFPKEHQQAQTPAEKRYYFCHCDYARAVAETISPTYCLCGAGWCKKIWSAVFERPVRVDIVQSVLQGDEVCQFAVHL